VCVLLYSAPELAKMRQGLRHDEQLRTFLEREGIAAIDTGPHILQALPTEKTFTAITVSDGHMTRRGDRLIAEALVDGLKRLGFLPG